MPCTTCGPTEQYPDSDGATDNCNVDLYRNSILIFRGNFKFIWKYLAVGTSASGQNVRGYSRIYDTRILNGVTFADAVELQVGDELFCNTSPYTGSQQDFPA